MRNALLRSSSSSAEEWLKKAIDRHKRHMDGSEPTDRESQMKMMHEMKKALAALQAA